MARVQQVLSDELKERLVHGGDHWKGRRKLARPITTRRAMHVTLRSSYAKGDWSLLAPAHARFIRELVPRLARRFHVRVYEQANSGNHLHFPLRPHTRDGLKKFLMVLSGRIAQKITGVRRGKPFGKRFFDAIPFSRIVQWGKAFHEAKHYVIRNTLEAMGLLPYRERKRARKMTRPPPLAGAG